MFSPTEIQLKHLLPVTHLAMGDSYHLQVDDRDGKNLVFCITAKWSKVLPVCKTQKKNMKSRTVKIEWYGKKEMFHKSHLKIKEFH